MNSRRAPRRPAARNTSPSAPSSRGRTRPSATSTSRTNRSHATTNTRSRSVTKLVTNTKKNPNLRSVSSAQKSGGMRSQLDEFMSQKRDIVISTPSGTRRISSGRTLAIIASCALVLILVAPTFFSYLEQQRALRQAQDELHAVQTHNAELKEELELWNNEDYVKAQARGRLGYVVPGETLYVITGDEEGSAADRLQARTAELQKARREATPWYMTMWDSLNVTGNLDEDGNVDNPDNVPMFEQPGVGTSKSPQTGTPVPDKGATGVADANAKDASEGTQ